MPHEYRDSNIPGVCLYCGKAFTGFKTKRYCDRLCSRKAYWAAHKDEHNAKRRRRKE